MANTKEQSVPMVHRHWFKSKGENGGQFQTFGADLESARPGKPDEYEYLRSETIPYKYTDFALSLAKWLGEDWTAVPSSDEHPDCNWYLKRADGLTLWMSTPCYSHKDQFRFSLSTFRDGQGEYIRTDCISIGCSVKKMPFEMSRDISRRLLPAAEKAFKGALAEIERRRVAADKQMATLTAVCEALGKQIRTTNGKPNFGVYFDGGIATVQYSGSVRFELHGVESEQGIKLAKAIREIGIA